MPRQLSLFVSVLFTFCVVQYVIFLNFVFHKYWMQLLIIDIEYALLLFVVVVVHGYVRDHQDSERRLCGPAIISRVCREVSQSIGYFSWFWYCINLLPSVLKNIAIQPKLSDYIVLYFYLMDEYKQLRHFDRNEQI